MKPTLVLGASPNPARYSFMAANLLHRHGHPIVLVGQKKGEVAGQAIQENFPESGSVDTVTLYVNPQLLEKYKESIVNLKPARVVFNPGTEHRAFAQELESLGIEAIEACTLVMLNTNQY